MSLNSLRMSLDNLGMSLNSLGMRLDSLGMGHGIIIWCTHLELVLTRFLVEWWGVWSRLQHLKMTRKSLHKGSPGQVVHWTMGSGPCSTSWCYQNVKWYANYRGSPTILPRQSGSVVREAGSDVGIEGVHHLLFSTVGWGFPLRFVGGTFSILPVNSIPIFMPRKYLNWELCPGLNLCKSKKGNSSSECRPSSSFFPLPLCPSPPSVLMFLSSSCLERSVSPEKWSDCSLSTSCHRRISLHSCCSQACSGTWTSPDKPLHKHGYYKSTSQSIDQSLNHSINWTINRSIYQSINRSSLLFNFNQHTLWKLMSSHDYDSWVTVKKAVIVWIW